MSFSFNGQDFIVVDPRKRNLAGQRFTLAHELGHILLGHGNSDTEWEVGEGAPAEDCREVEANQFASKLLLPKQLFKRDMRGLPTTFAAIGELAGRYDVSLTAAAIRSAHLTDEFCALIGSHTCPRRDWFVKSPPVERLWV